MIRIFYGENRTAALAAARKWLGEDYETVEGTELTTADLPNLFWGNSLFGDSGERRVLVRDLLMNKEILEKMPEYLETKHKIALLETKIDKRLAVVKDLAKAEGKVEFLEFEKLKDPNAGKVFEVYKVAKYDGKKAVAILDEIKAEQEPLRFLGLMTTQAIRDFLARPGAKEKRALIELSKLDLQLKAGTTLSPWLLISG